MRTTPRRKQRGFIYLTTGANGAGKTLFSLKEVHERSLKEARPVCYNGRFDLLPTGPLTSWKKIDIKDWQAEPDGTIFFVDECHNDFPVRGKEAAPEYVRMLAEHRKRGFDFYLITQHPMNIDNFVRRLVGSPGWHRHLKRTFGGDLVSRLEWAAVNPNCEKPGSGESGSTTMVPFPKEVYSWYTSAQLHTGKTRIPKVVWLTLAAMLAIPVLGYFAFKQVTKPASVADKVLRGGAPVAPGAVRPGGTAAAPQAPHVVTAGEYISARTPRIEGLAYTAPAYDGVTQPSIAPYPAACVDGFNRRTKSAQCHCYTQQGTRLPVPLAMCKQIAENGFFLEWDQPRAAPAAAPARDAERTAAVAPPPAPEPLPAPRPAATAPERPAGPARVGVPI